MSHAFLDYQGAVNERLQDAVGKLGVNVKDNAIRQAITQRYSKDAARELVADIAGNATADLALPATYEEAFSILRSIEYPISNVPATLVADEDWQLYRAPAGLKLRLLSAKPAASETLRLTYTVRHTNDGSTVPHPDFEAVCDFAAALCFDALAAAYVQVGDPTLGADVVNYRSKSQEYQHLAKLHRGRYFQHLGIDEDASGAPAGPAISLGELDLDLAGGDRLTHPKDTR